KPEEAETSSRSTDKAVDSRDESRHLELAEHSGDGVGLEAGAADELVGRRLPVLEWARLDSNIPANSDFSASGYAWGSARRAPERACMPLSISFAGWRSGPAAICEWALS